MTKRFPWFFWQPAPNAMPDFEFKESPDISWLQAGYVPNGFEEWARRFISRDGAWTICLRADWLLWMAKFQADSQQEHRRCAKAACVVARQATALVPPANPSLFSLLSAVEAWARGEVRLDDWGWISELNDSSV